MHMQCDAYTISSQCQNKNLKLILKKDITLNNLSKDAEII